MNLLKSLLLFLALGVGMFVNLLNVEAFTPAKDLNTVDAVKAELLAVAESHKGKGDPDLAIQHQLDPYVDRLVELNPQAPIAQRKDLLVGKWTQVWGPYNYDDTKGRGVDPTVDVDNIYQIVFPDGYFYNVGHMFKTDAQKETKYTTLMRGEYTILDNNSMDVAFKELHKINRTPTPPLHYTDLPPLAEMNTLEGEQKILWDWLVRLLIGGGRLEEVYTDDTLRLAYGSSNDQASYLYVLKRVEK